MTNWAIGLSTGCFFETPIFDALETIRNGGFSTIEICSYPAHLDVRDEDQVRRAGRMIQDLGLEPFSFHAPFADDIDITALDEGRQKYSLQTILQAARAAAVIEVQHFVIHPGPEEEGRPPAQDHLRRLENAANALTEVARFCSDHGMTLILENMLPHLLFGRTSDLLWIMGAIEAPNVGICLDTGHANLAGDLYTVMHKLSGHLHMIHASDNNGNGDDHLPPGQGGIDWKRFIQRLTGGGFNGGCILEISAKTASTPDGILKAARQARKHLRDILRRTQTASS
jgi:sugar phosphate isomerase/epimerase